MTRIIKKMKTYFLICPSHQMLKKLMILMLNYHLAFGNGLMMDDIVNQMEMGDDGNDADDFDDEANVGTPMGPTPMAPPSQQQNNSDYDDNNLQQAQHEGNHLMNNNKNNPLMS